ncbi:hypothetical protein [Nitrosomonas sp. sh817]|uniref:hypothetical protein n=1 Tax=Nitrosomonas sp. sh817 TaxID=3070658 RepID=UPI0027DB6750|nr:hypothetical protein [Nitrosomonas sp. sh817]WMJ09638.1 hypothetical protein RBH92_05445 [Nitrosomonas sp. sh817]
MEILKDFLTLFLQLTAIQVLLVSSWFIRKPKLRLATSIFVLNLDLALRRKTYDDCACLIDIFNQIAECPGSNHERILIGYRNPIREINVINELAEWNLKPKYFGPLQYANGNTQERWKSEFEKLKWNFGLSKDENTNRIERETIWTGNPLGRLNHILYKKYDYELSNIDSDEKSSKQITYLNSEFDVFVNLFQEIEEHCSNDKEKVEAIHRLRDASKIVNIIQIKNPYHSSINNIHFYISIENQGVMKLVTAFSEKQGFTIMNNKPQDIHLVLGELPPNSARYCIIETRELSLSEKNITIQSNLLLDKLSPQTMKPIILGAAIVSGLVILIEKYTSVEAVRDLYYYLNNLF